MKPFVLLIVFAVLSGTARGEEERSVLTALSETTLSGQVDASVIWGPTHSGPLLPGVADAVPEPSSVLLVGGGLLGAGLLRRRVSRRMAR